MHLSLIVHSSDADALAALRGRVHTLRAEGHDVRPRATFEGGDASRFAREAAEAGADVVVAAGGDGTVNEVVNGLHEWAAARGGDAPLPRLAIVPLGTANDLANAVGLPMDPVAALNLALCGVPRPIDVPTANGRCFVNVSTGGFGAEATEETNDEVKKVLGPLAYVVTGVRKFVALETASARFVCDGLLVYGGPFMLFAVGNSRRTGGGNQVTPEADLSDGLLDVCIVKGMSRLDFMALAPAIRAGKHLEHPAVSYSRVKTAAVEAEHTLSVNVDGEPITGRRFEYGLSGRRIELMRGG